MLSTVISQTGECNAQLTGDRPLFFKSMGIFYPFVNHYPG